MWEHETFYYQNILASDTSKSFCLPMKRSGEMKWFSQCHRLLWQWAITSFPSVTETSQAPGTLPVLPPLPPACCWNTLCSLPRSQMIVGAFTFYSKISPGKIMPHWLYLKKRYYWGHRLYTWISPLDLLWWCAGISPKQAHWSLSGIYSCSSVFHPEIALACTWLGLLVMWPALHCFINNLQCHNCFDTLICWFKWQVSYFLIAFESFSSLTESYSYSFSQILLFEIA